ncbi:TRM11 family SAM-dependent methyltransferase [Streptomyces sp. NPDC001118]|uniref:TRM11 family SAM-dependent methyltransferase n=1 Tax=Streptomyces sp. NPDC002589 TaxID=3154420 RepID=UPI003331AD91
MSRYGFLVSPSHNRVYAQSAPALAMAELAVFGERAVGGGVRDIEVTEIGGVPYVTFTADALTETDIRLLSNMSSVYALFALEADLLRPVAKHPLDLFGSDLLTIQKYAGKTNEDFTKLLVNVTALATDTPADLLAGSMRLFDPMCGRGTTLNQAVMYGMDAAGLDVDAKDFEAYSAFFRTWLKNNRLKHKAEVGPVRRQKVTLGRRLQVSLGASKDLYREGETIDVTVVNADTLKSGDFFRRGEFDLIVTDAPYGVQHGSRPQGGGNAGRLSRSPSELLAAAVPVWEPLLRRGGALGISWNTFVARREELAEILQTNGLRVRDSEAYLGFTHRVDQAINRDIIVATKD